MVTETEKTELFLDHRQFLFNIAYRMLGTAMEAEDMVQETYLRWQEVDGSKVDNARSYLAAMVTRQCIDYLRSAQARRETYPGPWLPEPVLTSTIAAPDDTVAMRESLSIAYLLMLERLSPTQRAAFLLREVFDYGYEEVAGILETSEANSRQLASRARGKMAGAPHVPAIESQATEEEALMRRFVSASVRGDIEELLQMLAPDVTMITDGGGKVPSATAPLSGAERVGRFIIGLQRYATAGMYLRTFSLNGQPALALYQADGQLEVVLVGLVREGAVATIYAMRNPDKLRLPEEQIRAESQKIPFEHI